MIALFEQLLMIEQILFLATGAIAGSLAGLLGVGGGIIVVPCLNAILPAHFSYELVPHIAVGTSFAIMMFTASSAAYAYHRRGLIIWSLFYKLIPGVLIGTIIGSIIARHLSGRLLLVLFSIFLLIIAFNMFFSKKTRTHNSLPSIIILNSISLLMGLCSGFFGIGGGTMMVPFFLYYNIETRKAAGTAALCGLPLAITGTITLILSGWTSTSIHSAPSGTIGYVYWPAALTIAVASLLFAPVGTRIAVWLPTPILKKIFAILLSITAINLMRE